MFLLKFFKFLFHFLICIFYDFVLKVTAIDKDISAPNNVVIYTLGDQDYSRRFQIDSHTGNITTRQPLDREQISVYFIDVTACDSAMSDRPNMNTPNCRTANVRIDVADTNDNEPNFNTTLYKASVSEDAERGTPILTIQANDLDENSQLRYIITDGNDDNVFAVREQIGNIYLFIWNTKHHIGAFLLSNKTNWCVVSLKSDPKK